MSDLLDRPEFNDPHLLRSQQYATGSNLDSRIALHERFSTNPYGWQRFVFDALLELPPDAQILEVGCGTAALWQENADRIPAGWQVTLTDMSPGMLEQARANLDALHRSINFERADADHLPVADGTLDAIVANHMLYHVPDRPAALAEFRRVLRPRGRLYAATNGAGHMEEQWALLARYAGVDGTDDWRAAVQRTFSLENGAEQLQAHFDHVEMHFYDDALEVTEVDPLVAYVASMHPDIRTDAPRFAEFVAQAMAEGEGVIRIEKKTGLFVAW